MLIPPTPPTPPTPPFFSLSSSSPFSSHFNPSAEDTLFHLFPSFENGELTRLVDMSNSNVDVVFVDSLELLCDMKAYFKMLLISSAAQQSSLRSAPSSSSSSSTGAARRSTLPFRRRRRKEKNIKGVINDPYLHQRLRFIHRMPPR
ncbi:uncharacterized protein MONOS_5616 [Monocercomonoides exilis]|uniref:uncharacterized protein n=1 Tax=Monocercomonoides exilis TaxID=2049356 RepID=UPI00355AB61F|nr:hypothetical protein MONOS_5616 [Monocercomonoides exilis]|eukprot:MONOS_5616.1-p1 / transcript=MONOS_5616.1 / gene=MONOS_5616 / organism=Monocercomonoides_exilis_PA203 / gene_product=unspecified product / transcript_product=unspecified product / location=Mono_scaffold00165:77284-77721(+) / protein_length=146 / sequence_SO=supercontig / SO=protein_coding / is_pseudo=false